MSDKDRRKKDGERTENDTSGMQDVVGAPTGASDNDRDKSSYDNHEKGDERRENADKEFNRPAAGSRD